MVAAQASSFSGYFPSVGIATRSFLTCRREGRRLLPLSSHRSAQARVVINASGRATLNGKGKTR